MARSFSATQTRYVKKRHPVVSNGVCNQMLLVLKTGLDLTFS